MRNRRIGAAAVIVNDEGGVPLVKQTYGRLNWELPGGAGEAGESPDETVLREVRRRGWTSPFLPSPGCDVLGACRA
jgi:8-oxo-dGTP pyrophosphatase MutT (NUDIX family)